MSGGWRGVIDWILLLVLGGGPSAESIRGDLREEYERRRSTRRGFAWLWYARQAGSVAWWSMADGVRGRPWERTHSLRRTRATGARSYVSDGVRVLRHSPGYSFAVVTTLGLALATAVTVFTVVRGVLLRDLPYPEADRLVRLDRIHEGRPGDGGVAWPDLLDWRERITSLEGISAYTGYEGLYVTDGVAEIWTGYAVTGNLLGVLGAAPALGPGFDEETGANGAHAILLAHGLWERRFGADPEVVGRTLEFDGERWQIVGVLPRGFEYPSRDLDFLVPLRNSSFLANRGAGFLVTIARLRPQVPLRAAQQEVDAVVGAIDAQHGEWREGVALRRYADVEVEPVRQTLLIFMGAVLLVLVVACANVTGLTLARTESRRVELAIRGSIGASRSRLVRQLLAESVILAVAGGVIGVFLAVAGVRALLAAAPADLPRRAAVHIDPAVLSFAVLAAVVAGVLFGLLPALRGSGAGTSAGLRSWGSGTREGRRSREILAAAQIAVAVILLSGAGLLLRSFAALTSVDPGFRTDGVLVVELGLDAPRYAGRDATLAFHDALLERLGSVPGVTRAGLSTHLPFSPSTINVGVAREGEVFERTGHRSLGVEVFNGDYLQTIGVPLVRGRMPEGAGGASAREVIINQTAARTLWPGEDPLGKRFSFDVEEGLPSAPETLFTVVGIVPDVLKEALDEQRTALAYYHLRDFSRDYRFVSGRYFYVTIATEGEASTLLGPVRDAIAGLDPALPIRSSASLEDLVRVTTVPARFRTFALGVFAVLAIAVAFVGIYGVMAYGVSRGLREIGVRMALGASPADVRSRVLGRATFVVSAGAVAGMAGALVTGPVLAGFLFRVPARDPLTLIVVLALATLGSVAAAWLPALRASRVDPMHVLRRE